MNESERLELLEKEIVRLKLELNQKNVYMPVCSPWEKVHVYIDNETIKRKGNVRSKERWQYFEAIRNVVRASLRLNNVRNLREDQVALAMEIAKNVIKAMETKLEPEAVHN